MKVYDFVQLVLLAADGRVEGRTKLQKLVYFSGVLSGRLAELGYRPHFYGPYSAQVSASVKELVSLKFLRQSISTGGALDRSGFEIARYDYVLTKDGRRLAIEKKRLLPKTWRRIKHAVTRIETGRPVDYVRLSIAAKTYFLRGRETREMTPEELNRLCHRFGWKVSPEELKEAISWLDSVGIAGEEGEA